MNSKLDLKNILRVEGMMNLSSVIDRFKEYSGVILKVATKSQQFVGLYCIFFQYVISTCDLDNKFRSFNNLNIKSGENYTILKQFFGLGTRSKKLFGSISI